MRAVWINDIHLEFLDEDGQIRFFEDLRSRDPDCVILAGDIAQAPSVVECLSRMGSALRCPIYFVLGNHDYYNGSIPVVRRAVREACTRSRHLHWLSASGAVRLTEKTALIGHDGWGDGRLGDFARSSVQLNDFLLIRDLQDKSGRNLLKGLNALGDEAAQHIRSVLPEALAIADHIVVVTHVPPFLEATWHEGRHSGPDWLPFFSCKAVGDVLRETMLEHPDKRMTVLCGHTHGGGAAEILPNLITHTGAARYGHPAIQAIFEWV